MSYQVEPQKTAYPDVHPPSQSSQYTNQPQSHGQPTQEQYYPPLGQYIPDQYAGQYPGQNPPQYYPPQPQPGTVQWGPPPAEYSSQQQSASVVVVNAQPTVAVTQQPRPRDYLILSIVSIVLCAFFGLLVGMLCPLPALIFSLKPTVAVTQLPRPRDYLILSIVSIVLCAFFGLLVGMICPLPALIFSLKASSANESGNHETAKKFGRISLGWNIGVYIFYTVVTITWIAVVASHCTSFFGRVICF